MRLDAQPATGLPNSSDFNFRLQDEEREPLMHILIAIVGIVAAAAFWYWRMKAVAEVAGEIGDAAGRLRGKINRARFRRKVEGSTLTGIDDPRLGAAVMLVSLVEAGRPMTREDEAIIARWLRDVAEEEEPEEAITFARWACREVVDVNEVQRRLAPLFRNRLGAEERAQLVEVAASLSRPAVEAPAQADALRRLRNTLVPDAGADPTR